MGLPQLNVRKCMFHVWDYMNIVLYYRTAWEGFGKFGHITKIKRSHSSYALRRQTSLADLCKTAFIIIGWRVGHSGLARPYRQPRRPSRAQNFGERQIEYGILKNCLVFKTKLNKILLLPRGNLYFTYKSKCNICVASLCLSPIHN